MKKVILAIALTVATLHANVTISSASYQKKVKVNEVGEKVTSWAKADKVVPGSIVRYLNVVENSGTQIANKLVVNNPIPTNMEYVAGTASCLAGCTITYSVDGGVTFQNASELFVETVTERHLAKASEYTDIRWVIEILPAMSETHVEYQAQLK